MKESRSTISPGQTGIGLWKIGPSKTKVWNSPFSPQGSTPEGKSRKKEASSSRPAKLRSRTLGSMHADAVIRFGDGGQQRDDPNIRQSQERVQRHCAVFAAGPAEEDGLAHR